ncbi:hypothetical protein MRB53_008161 [Persea americana]|uniref:Uncharacterized protein n=1 Tax=Persea americana TaxID=3435 RepID=A0ACC2MLM4_PERAE|nr:hypothetical protein MRB53_008161 [Persea americana]
MSRFQIKNIKSEARGGSLCKSNFGERSLENESKEAILGHLLKLPSLLTRLLEARVSGHFFFGLLQSGLVSEVGKIVEKRVRGVIFGDIERFWILGFKIRLSSTTSRFFRPFEFRPNPCEKIASFGL